MYLSPLKGEFNSTTQTTKLIPLGNCCYSPPNYNTLLQPLLPLSSNENERRFSLLSAEQSPSSSTNSSSSEGSPQIQRKINNEQLIPNNNNNNNIGGILLNNSKPSIDCVQIDSSASRSSGIF
jgi:hypothetical protein